MGISADLKRRCREPISYFRLRIAFLVKSYLQIEFRLLKLEVIFLAPRLLGLLNGGHGVDLDVAVVNNLVAVFIPADADLQSFA